MNRSLPGSSVHGIFPARILEWVDISFSRGSSQARAQTRISCHLLRCRQILCHWATREVPYECLLYSNSSCCPLTFYEFFFFFFFAALGLCLLRYADSVVVVPSLLRSTRDLSLWTRDQTPVPWIGKQILHHWTTREIMNFSLCVLYMPPTS